MTHTLRVYLAGPIRGCTEEQKTWWREEVKQRLGRQFEFEDPTDWADDKGVPREIAKLEACDIVLANMWKESIGTTVGIIRANDQGKPVVLIDPNHMDNSILESLVFPESPVRSIDEACRRLVELAGELGPLRVRKRSGEEEHFYPRKLTSSVARAAAEAGVNDPSLEELISKPAIVSLRRKGEQRAAPGLAGWVTTEEIRQELFDQLEHMSARADMPADVRARAERTLAAWHKKEQFKKGEGAIQEAEERVRRAEEEAARWKQLFLELREKGIPEAEAQDEQQPASAARFKSVDQVLDRFARKWREFVLIHDEAKATARSIKPALTAHGREELFALLEELGEFARDRAIAAAEEQPLPTFEERFGDRYAATESGETKRRYRKETRTFEGRQYSGLQHLKMKTEAGQRIRLYFDQLPSGRLLIGWIGHRETYSRDG